MKIAMDYASHKQRFRRDCLCRQKDCRVELCRPSLLASSDRCAAPCQAIISGCVRGSRGAFELPTVTNGNVEESVGPEPAAGHRYDCWPRDAEQPARTSRRLIGAFGIGQALELIDLHVAAFVGEGNCRIACWCRSRGRRPPTTGPAHRRTKQASGHRGRGYSL